jgi:hypothetical protein
MQTLRHTALLGVMLVASSCKFFASKDRDIVQTGQRGTGM